METSVEQMVRRLLEPVIAKAKQDGETKVKIPHLAIEAISLRLPEDGRRKKPTKKAYREAEEELQRQLREAGFEMELADLDDSEYFEWLTKRRF